jgi:gliding motility-associated-like protein
MRRWIVCLGLLTGMVAIGNTLWAQEPTPCDYQLPMRASNWVFGEQAQMVFNQDLMLDVFRVEAGIDFEWGGMSSISDENGNLLFISDGKNLFSGNYRLFQGVDDLEGSPASDQSALFVPHPGREDKIYLFTVDMYIMSGNGVQYSTLERSSQGWNLVEKNKLLHQSNAQKITAVKHADESHYWVITHGYNNTGNKFFAWLVDSLGVAESPVETPIGAMHRTNLDDLLSFNNNRGYMRTSSDGTKIALTIPHDGIIELFDFNTTTGVVSNLRSSGLSSFFYPIGLEFSPDNSKLYATTSPRNDPSSPTQIPSELYQFDLSSENPFLNYTTVYTQVGTDTVFGALQLGSDGRIYLARTIDAYALDRLGVINNPNRYGLACNYNHLLDDNNGFFLEGGMTYKGLPNFVTSFLDIPHFYWQNHCHTYITAFNLRNEANIESIEWDFGDGGAISDDLRAEHTFSEPGRYYTVNVTENYNGQAYTKSRNIYIHPLPEVDIGQGSDTIFLLPNSSITLDAGIFDAYAWEPSGSTERFLDVDAEGWVTVTVTDSNCCVNTASVYIAFSNIFLPTAFRPGSDRLVNSQFKVLGATSAIADFRIYIYNRWGELVFESADPDTGWDGTITNGNLAPMGTYAWVMYYESFGTSLQPPQKINRRGTVTLVR